MGVSVSLVHSKIYRNLKNFKNFKFAVAHHIGTEGVDYLWSNYLTGPKIFYRGKLDKKGRRKHGYSIRKEGRTIRFSSYPLNLWERGFTKRRGRSKKDGTGYDTTGAPVMSGTSQGATVRGKFVFRDFGRDVRGTKLARWAEKGIEKRLSEVFGS